MQKAWAGDLGIFEEQPGSQCVARADLSKGRWEVMRLRGTDTSRRALRVILTHCQGLCVLQPFRAQLFHCFIF